MSSSSTSASASLASEFASDFVLASADHQDACYRLVQYSCRLIGCAQNAHRQQTLKMLSASIDSARALTRSFGFLSALRALTAHRDRQPSTDATFALCCDSILFAYHPIELWYYGLVAVDSPQSSRRRLLSRLISGLTLAYNVCGAARAAIALRRASSAAAADDGGDATRERRLLAKLALDSLLAAHWTIDGPAFALREWQVGLCGTASALLGLAMQARAHRRLQAPEEEEEGDADGGTNATLQGLRQKRE